jgi:hypothetical protein
MGSRLWSGAGYKSRVLWFRVKGLGLWFRAQGLGFRV